MSNTILLSNLISSVCNDISNLRDYYNAGNEIDHSVFSALLGYQDSITALIPALYDGEEPALNTFFSIVNSIKSLLILNICNIPGYMPL